MKLTSETLDIVIETRPGLPGKLPNLKEETNPDGTPVMDPLTLRRVLVEAALSVKDTDTLTQAQLLEKYDFTNKISNSNGVGALELTVSERARLLDGTIRAFKGAQGDYIFGEVHKLLDDEAESPE